MKSISAPINHLENDTTIPMGKGPKEATCDWWMYDKYWISLGSEEIQVKPMNYPSSISDW